MSAKQSAKNELTRFDHKEEMMATQPKAVEVPSLPTLASIATEDHSYRFAARMSRMHVSAIREILKVTEHPEIISFAGGLPAPELFPVSAIA